jgi:hypothetical protein
MAAGIVDKLLDVGDLFDVVTEHAQRQVRDARLEKLIDRLNRPEL